MTDEVVTQLADVVGRLRDRSRWALETALTASATEGVACTLVVSFPANPRHVPEAQLLAGAWEPRFADQFTA